MAIPERFAEVVADLNAELAPRGFSLVIQPGLENRALLTGGELEEVIQVRRFLNHGFGHATHSGIILAMSPRGVELTIEHNFEIVLASSSFDPQALLRTLLRAAADVLERHRKFIADANPLHQKLLQVRESIVQAGFYLVPTHFVTNLETRRELKRTTKERVDLISVTLGEGGQLVATTLHCVFDQPIPVGTALKVMGIGLPRT